MRAKTDLLYQRREVRHVCTYESRSRVNSYLACSLWRNTLGYVSSKALTNDNGYVARNFFQTARPHSHWLLRGHMTSKNESVSRQNP